MRSRGEGRRIDRRWGLLGLLATLLALVTVSALDVAEKNASRASKGDQSGRAGGGTPEDHDDADRTPVPGLLPNMRIQPADNVSLDTSGKGRRLRFDATLVNVGA